MLNRILMFMVILITMTSCKKFLSEKSDKKLVIPTRVHELQSLFDRGIFINSRTASTGEMSADNYYIPTEVYNGLNADFSRNVYTWEGHDLYESSNNDWNYTYTRVYFANSVIETLKKIERTERNGIEWDDVKGQAYGIRALEFLTAVQAWAKVYNPATAKTDLGIPLRLNDDFNERSVRATVQETFDRILADLKIAIPLLPEVPAGISRMSKPAAYAIAARTYLYMGNYGNAKLYADSALLINSELLDFNSLQYNNILEKSLGIMDNNEVVLLKSANTSGQLLDLATHRVDSFLYDSFHDDDLRKTYFFEKNLDNSFSFKGNYQGRTTKFFGISNSELYLIRAECLARADKIIAAMGDLNTLLRNRWDNGITFAPLVASTKQEALDIILMERRKELMFRGLRWSDLKRLNRDGANITLTRVIDGKTYTLPPNDNRYALPIPEDIIELSGMPQNPQ